MNFSKNDIYRASGIVLIAGGQFLGKTMFNGFGISVETNVVQIAGMIILLVPFAIKYFNAKKDEIVKNQLPPQS